MSALTIVISLVMVVITGYYARLTKTIVDIARKTFDCQLAPVKGIEVPTQFNEVTVEDYTCKH